jgi:N-acyl-D-amino-acid deacylase
VRIVDDRNAAVGDFESAGRDTVIDAGHRVLAPGFIDTHSHHENGLFEMPGALAAVSQGLTTSVASQAGREEYPLAEFYVRLETLPVAINAASHAGRGTLRSRIMGYDCRRHVTAEERDARIPSGTACPATARSR